MLFEGVVLGVVPGEMPRSQKARKIKGFKEDIERYEIRYRRFAECR